MIMESRNDSLSFSLLEVYKNEIYDLNTGIKCPFELIGKNERAEVIDKQDKQVPQRKLAGENGIIIDNYQRLQINFELFVNDITQCLKKRHTSSEKSLSYCFFTLFIEGRAVFNMIDLAGTLSNWNESKNVLNNSWKLLSRHIYMMMLEQRANMSVMECFKNPFVQMIRTTFKNNVTIFIGNIVTKKESCEVLQFSNIVRKIKIKRNDSNQSRIGNEELSRDE